MSVKGCVAYICNERGITAKPQPKSKKMIIDHVLEDLAVKQAGEDCEILGVNLCESPRPISEAQRLASVKNKINWNI